MSKDFRAKQVRTNKIIGRSDAAVGAAAPKVQLALMKSGSADFAGSLTNPGGATPDVGRLKQVAEMTADGGEHRGIGNDVWMVVDGNSSNRNKRSEGEAVLFLGDVVVSGTIYAERQRVNVTTQALINSNDPVAAFSGSVFIAQDSGMTVGKNVVFQNDTFTDPRTSLSLTRKDSVFFNGEGTPGALLVVKPDDDSNKGRIGIGVAAPAAKLEIVETTEQLRLTNNTDEYASFTVNNTGGLTIETVGAGSTDSNLVLDADGDIHLDAAGGDVKFIRGGATRLRFDISTGVNYIQNGVDGADIVFRVDAGSTEIARFSDGGSSFRLASDKKIEFRDTGIFAHSNADGKFKLSADGDAADAITIEASDAAGGIDIDAGSGGINITTNGGTSEKILIKNTLGNTEAASADAAIRIQAAAGGITLDAEKDIHLDANGGQVRITDGGISHFEFDCDTTKFTIYDDANQADFFSIQVATDGATTLASSHTEGSAPHNNADITIDSDGKIFLDSHNGYLEFKKDGAVQYRQFSNSTSTLWLGYTGTTSAYVFSLENWSYNSATQPSVRMRTDHKLEFRDNALSIHSSADGQLDINADTEIQITAPTVDIDASSEVNISNNLVVGGNLTVNGTTTTISTTNLDVEDAIIVLQAELGSGTANATDLGIIMERGSTGDNAAIIWDESIDTFVIGTTAETGSDTEVAVTPGDVRVNMIEFNGPGESISIDGSTMKFANDNHLYSFGGGSTQILRMELDGDDGRIVTPYHDNIKIAASHFSGGLVTTDLMIFGNNDTTPTVRVTSDTKLEFRDANIYIQSDSDANLKVASDGDIDLTAANDINIPASVGLTFGADTNKIEVDGSNDMAVITANDMAFQTGGADGDQFLFRNGADISEETKICIGDASTFIERQGGSSTVRFVSDRPIQLDCGGTLTLDGNSGVNIKHADTATLSVTRSTDTILFANHANDIVFQTAPAGSAVEIARFDTSAASLLMPTANKVQFREATNFVNSSASNTLDIEAGSSDNGTINIGTDQGHTIVIGKSGVAGATTTIHNLTLPAITVSGNTGAVTFFSTADSGATDPVIQRNAAGVLTFTDSANPGGRTLSDLSSTAADATAFSTVAGDRKVIASVRRLAIIGSGSVGGNQIDELYGYTVDDTSDMSFFVSGSVKPINKSTPHGAGTNFERNNAAFDSNLVASGSIFMRGLYHTNGSGDIITATGQSSPHPVGTPGSGYTGYVFTVDQTNAPGAAASSLHGTAFLHGNLQFTYSAPDIRIPTDGLEFTDANGSNTVLVAKPSSNTVIVPSNKKLGFSNPESSYLKSDGTDLEIASNSSIIVSLDKDQGTNPSDATFVVNDGGGTERFKIEETGNVTITGAAGEANGNLTIADGDLYVRGGDIYGVEGGQLRLTADSSVIVTLDAADNSTNDFFTVNDQDSNSKFKVTESGEAYIASSLDLGHATDTTITRDASGDIAIEGNRVYRAGGTDVAVADGGTGASTASGARTNLGLGSLSTLSTISNTNWSGADLSIANGGTGASSAAGARTNLGLEIGTDVQAYDAQLADVAGLTPGDGSIIIGDGGNFITEAGATARASLGLTIGTHVQAYDAELSAIAGLTSAADKGIQFTGSGTAGVYDLTAAGKALLDDADAAAQRTTLGLVIGTDVQAYDAQLADVAGLATTDGGFIVGDGSNFVLEAGATARLSLGLGNSSSPTFSGLDLSDGNIVNAGDINCDSISVDSAGTGLDIQFGGNTTLNKISLTDNLADALNITEGGNSYMKFVTSNSLEKIEVSQHIIPVGTVDLGSNANRFANIYTNDLNLCNEGRGNDVDGTSGNWTIQEGAENLYVINNLTGKKYKMALTPVEEE